MATYQQELYVAGDELEELQPVLKYALASSVEAKVIETAVPSRKVQPGGYADEIARPNVVIDLNRLFSDHTGLVTFIVTVAGLCSPTALDDFLDEVRSSAVENLQDVRAQAG